MVSKHKLIYLGVILIGAALALTVLGAVKIYSNDKILPRTTFWGEQIGLMEKAQIANLVTKAAEITNSKTYTVILGGEEKEITLQDLGVGVDYNQTIASAPSFDVQQDYVFKLAQAFFTSREMRLKPLVDEEKFLQKVETDFNFAENKMSNAKLVFNEQKELIIQPEKDGETIDTTNLMQQLEDLINGSTDKLILTTVNSKPILTAKQLEAGKAELVDKLSKNVRLEFEHQTWQFRPLDHTDNLTFVEESYVKFPWFNKELPIVLNSPLPASEDYEIKNHFNVEVKSQLNQYLDENIGENINKSMQSAKIYYDESDNIVIEGTAENGQEISKGQLQKMLALSINHKIGKLTIPVSIVKAQVEADERLAQQGIKEMIAVGHTTFFGSPNNRVHNIGVGIQRYNGTLVKQGEEFSFNKILGSVEASTGYLPELVIKGKEGTVPEYGGGLCQVSSTAYRAALFAGLPIVERAAHSYAVSYYAQVLGYGLDATIYPGVRDLKFINDTPGDIIIQSYAKDGHAYFKFYGTSDNRSVKLEGPYVGNHRSAPPAEIIQTNTLPPGVKKQKENAHNGFDATWFRYLTKNGETVKETIFSNYRAVPAKIMVGAGEVAAADDKTSTENTPELSS